MVLTAAAARHGCRRRRQLAPAPAGLEVVDRASRPTIAAARSHRVSLLGAGSEETGLPVRARILGFEPHGTTAAPGWKAADSMVRA